jgi:hypothetical protein
VSRGWGEGKRLSACRVHQRTTHALSFSNSGWLANLASIYPNVQLRDFRELREEDLVAMGMPLLQVSFTPHHTSSPHVLPGTKYAFKGSETRVRIGTNICG